MVFNIIQFYSIFFSISVFLLTFIGHGMIASIKLVNIYLKQYVTYGKVKPLLILSTNKMPQGMLRFLYRLFFFHSFNHMNIY